MIIKPMLKDDFNTARELTQNHEYDAAIALYKKILEQHPDHSATHYNLAQLAAKLGDVTMARTHFERVIALEPDFPQGYFQLAQILLLIGEHQAAIEALETALSLAPDYIDAQHLLACSALQQQQIALAETHFKQLLVLAPTHAAGHLNFALLKLQQQDIAQASDLLNTALALDPTLIEAHYHRGVIAMQLGDIEGAILEMQETLDRQASHFAANYNLAILYKMQNHYQLATHYLKIAQGLKPDDENISFLLHAFAQDNTPAQAPKAFVKELFNHYAQDYDVHMQKSLHYQTPQQLRALLNDHLLLLPKEPVFLDLGCGTGLSGACFKDCGTLIGVDLAADMLTIASKRGIYQQLVEADITEYIQQCPKGTIDLIIAADVLGYMGDLDQIFSDCARILRPHGLFLFSIELSKDQDYILQTCARYAHSKAYIEKLTHKNNFHLIAAKNIALREQAHVAVMGEIFLLQKR